MTAPSGTEFRGAQPASKESPMAGRTYRASMLLSGFPGPRAQLTGAGSKWSATSRNVIGPDPFPYLHGDFAQRLPQSIPVFRVIGRHLHDLGREVGIVEL